jgi:hypothetical protein
MLLQGAPRHAAVGKADAEIWPNCNIHMSSNHQLVCGILATAWTVRLGVSLGDMRSNTQQKKRSIWRLCYKQFQAAKVQLKLEHHSKHNKQQRPGQPLLQESIYDVEHHAVAVQLRVTH